MLVKFKWTGEPDQLDGLTTGEKLRVLTTIVILIKKGRLHFNTDGSMVVVSSKGEITRIHKDETVILQDQEKEVKKDEKSKPYSIACV